MVRPRSPQMHLVQLLPPLLLLLLLHTTSASASPPLAVTLEGVFGEAKIKQVEQLVAHVQAVGDRELVGQTRNFGEEKQREGGHSVTFLHAHAEELMPGLVNELWELGVRADAEAGWAIADALEGDGRPGLRCLELIEYYAGSEPANEEEKAPAGQLSNSLGWHVDGHTLLTVAVLLSYPGVGFAGGEVEVRRKGHQEQHGVFAPGRGDAAVWRGWDYHRVRPVTRGVRRVLVAEFWTGPDVEGTENRLTDFAEGFQQAAEIDPDSAFLHSHVAWGHYSNEELEAALQACQRGLAADPEHGDLAVLLGMVKKRQGKLDEAAASLESALQLRPRDVLALLALAEVRGEQGQQAEMERCYIQAREASPDNLHAVLALGELWERLGRFSEAEEALSSAIRIAPEDKELAGDLASDLARVRQLRRGRELARLTGVAVLTLTVLFVLLYGRRAWSGASVGVLSAATKRSE